ncbi:hypothetical protein K438DRAFT_1169899 [Mycena galopus ATCC 62051]|nr:hypothetical protein K438DRAFT_1169899 [Mycena galopus ATCC 62051]
MQLSREIWGKSGDGKLYNGLRRFHQAKNFDPNSQDVARYLGKPLYRTYTEMHTGFVYVDHDEHSCNGQEEYKNTLESANSHHVMSEDHENSRLAPELSVSDTFKFVLSLKLSLILVVVLSWLYDKVLSRRA